MIIVGYQGIGKSSLAGRKGYIDLESGNLWYYGDYNKEVRDKHWYKIYVNFAIHLSQQGYNVFVSSHRVVRDELRARKEKFCVVYPSKELKDAWLEKLYTRYMLTDKIKDYKAYVNAKDFFDENIDDLAQEEVGIEIRDKNYILENELQKFFDIHEA